MKRSIATTLALVALGLGACSSDDGDTAETGEAPDTEAVAAVVTPTVACVDDQRLMAYFAYTNSGDEAVEIPVGEANAVTLPDGSALTEQQPAVFAPGEQGPVFWVPFIDPATPVTWSLTGADGTAHTAATDESSPECEFGPTLDPPDDREATVVGTAESDGESATVTLTVEGLDPESRCPSGDHAWTPEEPLVTISALSANGEVVEGDDPSVVQVEIVDIASTPFEGFDVVGFASIEVFVDVDDHCTDEAGATSEAWAASPALRDLNQIGTKICFGAVDDGYDEVGCDEGPQLAPTGGIRSR